jgi:hypothetical protein
MRGHATQEAMIAMQLGTKIFYLKNLYVHFIKKIFLDCSAKALLNKLLVIGELRSSKASGELL